MVCLGPFGGLGSGLCGVELKDGGLEYGFIVGC